MPERSIMHGQAARAALIRGVDLMAGLLRPTLGPAARTVAIARIVGSDPPEVLDSAATIARRTIQFANPYENMGAMLVRHLAWKVFERAGDGAATAAVLAQALVHEAATYIAAGGNPMLVKRGVEHGLSLASAELKRQARRIELPSEIAGLVSGIVRDPKLADMIGEIMDSVGQEGAVLIEDASGIETGYEYVDGVRWNEGYVSHFLLKEGDAKARLIDPRIFVTDYALEKAEQLLPVLEACVGAGERSLCVIAPEVRGSALGLLIVNRDKGVLSDVVAVKAPSIGEQRTRILEDIAVISGGRCLHQEWQERLEGVAIEDLGKARQVWATRSAFGILGGHGSKGAIRQRIGEARGELGTVGDDDYKRDKVRERIGKLAGTAAVIRVGAPSQSEQAELKLRVEAAVASARCALEAGIVPGGGAGLLACAPALEAAKLDGDEAVGVQILARALAEPMRVIVRNAGLDPGPIVHEAHQRGPGSAFDVIHLEWVDAWRAGIVDPLTVALTALETSVSAATMAITTEVLIRRRNPPIAVNP